MRRWMTHACRADIEPCTFPGCPSAETAGCVELRAKIERAQGIVDAALMAQHRKDGPECRRQLKLALEALR